MDDVNLKDRNLVFSSYVNKDTVGPITKVIQDINTEDADREAKEVGYQRKPIKLYLNCFGGSVYDGLGLIGVIESSKTPIHIICTGEAMSMGLWILLSGHKRYATKYASIMYHDISCCVDDKLEGIKLEVIELERLNKICDDMVVARTKILRSKLEEIRSKKQDWYISAQEALELGIVEELI